MVYSTEPAPACRRSDDQHDRPTARQLRDQSEHQRALAVDRVRLFLRQPDDALCRRRRQFDDHTADRRSATATMLTSEPLAGLQKWVLLPGSSPYWQLAYVSATGLRSISRETCRAMRLRPSPPGCATWPAGSTSDCTVKIYAITAQASVKDREPDRRLLPDRSSRRGGGGAGRCRGSRRARAGGARARLQSAAARRRPAATPIPPSSWSYQKPGGLAWPNETMRSMRRPGRRSSMIDSFRCTRIGERRRAGSRRAAARSSAARSQCAELAAASYVLCRKSSKVVVGRRRLPDRVVRQDEFAEIAVCKRPPAGEPAPRSNPAGCG